MPPYVDFHTHRRICTDNTIEVISSHPPRWKPAQVYTIGYHPWWTEEPLLPMALAELSHHYKEVDTCLGLGELGFDQLKGPALSVQDAIFHQQISLANDLQAPVVIHCVRAFDRLLKARRQVGQTDWVVHGFMRNRILAKQLLDQGLFLSLAPYHRMHQSYADMLRFVPLDRIFLETDSDYRLGISERYHIFASLRNMDMLTLRTQLYLNFTLFYSTKWQHLTGSNALNY